MVEPQKSRAVSIARSGAINRTAALAELSFSLTVVWAQGVTNSLVAKSRWEVPLGKPETRERGFWNRVRTGAQYTVSRLLGSLCNIVEQNRTAGISEDCFTTRQDGKQPWEEFALDLVIGACAHHIGGVILHLFFLTLWSGCFVWRNKLTSSDGANSDETKGHSSTLQRRDLKLSYWAALGACYFLLLLNWGIAGWVLFYGWLQRWRNPPILVAATAVTQGMAWLVMSLLTKNSDAVKREKYPGLLRAWWILCFIWFLSALPKYYLLRKENTVLSLEGIWDVASCIAGGYLFLMGVRGKTGFQVAADRLHDPLLDGHKYERLGKQKVTDFSGAGLLSLAALSWVSPLLALGSRKQLELRDIPLLIPRDRAQASSSAFIQKWSKQKEKLPPSLLKTLFRSFWKEAAWTGALGIINSSAIYVGPFLIVDFVNYVGGQRRFPYEGCVLVSSFVGSKLAETLSQRQWEFGTQRLGLHIRSALTALVYRKGIRLSKPSRMSYATGDVMNYMAVDAERLSEFSWYLHDIWILPLQVILAVVILYRTVGLGAITTLVTTVITLAVNAPVSAWSGKFQDKMSEAKDERMESLSEALRSMRVLKFQAWEQRYREKVEYLRKIECHWLAKALYAAAASSIIFLSAPMFVAAATFGTCIILGHPLTVGRVLSALATIRALQSPVDAFPKLVTVISQIRVSHERLKSFLREEELPLEDIIRLPYEDAGENKSVPAVEIEGGYFSWNPSSGVAALRNVDITISRGARVAVCGNVGAGKSSFLSCILGEMPKLCGTVKVTGTSAYVAQFPWIQSGTVEENIRFGSPMDRVKYKDVLRVCSLEKDLALFAFGDQTQVGERGINLSEGQKQRLQLARAVYQDADIYLLDDPFSCMDAQTSSYLFRECILTTLASKTVIFVTHHVEYLSAADVILVMRDGGIVQAGHYEEVLEAGTDFSSLLGDRTHEKEPSEVNGYSGCDELSPGYFDEFGHVDADEDSDKLSITDSEVTVDDYVDKLEIVDGKPQEQQEVENHDEQQRRTDNGRLGIYLSYLRAVSHGAYIPVIVLVQIIFQVLQIGSNYWMAWATPAAAADEQKVNNLTLILVYVLLASGSSIFVFCRAMLVSVVGLMTAQKYFVDMLRSIFHAPMSIFDSATNSRILTRASSDQTVLDLNMQFRFSGILVATVELVGVIAVMSQVTWEVSLLSLPTVVICVAIQRYYMASAREFSHLVGVQKSPIIHHFCESVQGAATVRSFGQEGRFMRTNLKLFDRYARPYFYSFAATEWLIMRVEMLSALVFASSLITLTMFPAGAISQSIAGLVVTYGLQLNSSLSRWVWNLCNIENKITSAERVQQCSKLPSEAPLLIEKCRPPRNWPIYGTIKLQNLQARYNEYTPLVLKDITCTFPGGNKVGIVGRAGSGKATLVQAIFRMVEPTGGKILIDGIDISTIGLHDLRSRLTIIPQEPILFEGTIRGNLDPMDEYCDADIWETLDKCQLGDVVRENEEKLEASVSENGKNWSVGQRQLLCLGRALLKHNRIVVVEEVTALIDPETDGIIRRTIKSAFAACTVLTVAHHIPTAIDSDYVLVLSEGRVVEYNAPLTLMEDKSSLFSKLLRDYSYRAPSVLDTTEIGR
ncbi:hypothetical protein R1sor_013740 [Riccia sorocarpa]|uniref:Uncharacterized protein n=1 Tax=Riccia sorocarpa TaxID=122646 RepID=A0ABD3HBJ1_9MARC